jgi:hypothetical protein
MSEVCFRCFLFRLVKQTSSHRRISEHVIVQWLAAWVNRKKYSDTSV